MENNNNVPLISKEEFVEQINFIKSNGEKFNRLCDLMEELSPGFRVDFLPNFSYNEKIIRLLNILMHEDPEDSLIDYYVYDLGFGEEEELKPQILFAHKIYSVATPEDLYDTLVHINFNQTAQTDK